MDPIQEFIQLETRRHFLKSSSLGLGTAALAHLFGVRPTFGDGTERNAIGGLKGIQSIAPRAKNVIFLFQSGGPSQLDLFDYKPELKKRHGTNLPDSVRQGQRLTGFTNNQKSLPVAASPFQFRQHGKCGAWVSDQLPHLSQVVDDICFLKGVHSEAINHDPARMLMQTGSQLAGRPGMGSWVSYGLGSECQNLPAFMVLTSMGSQKRTAQPISIRLWGSGFLPSKYQGVKLQSSGDPILYVSNPPGVDATVQRQTLEAIAGLNRRQLEQFGDSEIASRTAQYEMAFRMQTSVPELTDTSDEPESTFKLYGDDAHRRGTYAANCLLARRMVERGVRFVQLYHVDWDHHESVNRDIPLICKDVDQASAALITDLKQRGLLDETLVIWGGEFGRTVFTQGDFNPDSIGRDHHGRAFTMWMAGGGIRGGMTYGATDEYSYSVIENPVHVHDLQATILHQLGIDHTALTYRFQGRDFRLTDVHGEVIRPILL